MLRVADRYEEHGGVPDLGTDALAAEPLSISIPAPSPLSSDRYRAHRSVSLPGIILVVAIHAILIFALIHVRSHYVRHKEEKLTVVNLTPPPAPPPPAAEAPPPPARPDVVAPPPIVRTPVAQPPQIQTTSEPSPVSMPVSVAKPAPPVPAPSAPAAPSTVQGGDISAQMVSGKPPRYPVESRRKREQGTVLLSLVVGLDGRVATISIAQSSGFSRLDDAARDAVRGWRWSPIMRDGHPVMVKGVVEIPFVIKN
ncbi:TonB family protein [Sphingobium sp. AN558]|uniref:energy transducer TonB n=1 Tax=Sphingobium sp. AN558 TaxID=3133442 RepID=UPI0030BBB8F4